MNYWESCCPSPENCGANLPIIFFKLNGEREFSFPVHIYLISSAYAQAKLPFVPNGFVLLISFIKLLDIKYSVIYLVLLKHCNPLFI